MRYVRFLAPLALLALLFTSCNVDPDNLPLPTIAVVITENNVDKDMLNDTKEAIRTIDGVQSVSLIPREDLIAVLEEVVPDDVSTALQGNTEFMPDVFVAVIYNPDGTEPILEDIRALPHVNNLLSIEGAEAYRAITAMLASL